MNVADTALKAQNGNSTPDAIYSKSNPVQNGNYPSFTAYKAVNFRHLHCNFCNLVEFLVHNLALGYELENRVEQKTQPGWQ